MVKSQCRLIATITTSFASTTFLLNQQAPSLVTAMLLRYVILMFAVCGTIFTQARTELGLPAGQYGLAN
jgi:hypothetical protein